MLNELGRAGRVVLALGVASALAAGARAAEPLRAAEVQRIVAQAASEAQARGLHARVAVTDARGRLLASFRMDGAPDTVTFAGPASAGLQAVVVPAAFAAQSKAGTGALLSSGGHAFSTRTASFIVQEHFPPGLPLTPGGPLFGVQFSSLPCGIDGSPALPLGLSGDPGGFPLYRDGLVVGGVGVEADGRYGVDRDAMSLGDVDDSLDEEAAALAGTRGFEAPALVQADNIFADAIRLLWSNAETPDDTGGSVAGVFDLAPRDAMGVGPASLPSRGGSILTAADVQRVLDDAAAQSRRTRAAIRQPLGSHARVSIAVVDVDGRLLGLAQDDDAPAFGIDVSVQKARTAAFFSSPRAGDSLAAAGLGAYATGVPLDGSVAYTTRAIGVLAQPLFPSGIDGTDPGPFATALPAWSPFNTGLQLDLVRPALLAVLAGSPVASCARPGLAALPNGITVFPGGIPLFKDGRLAGAIGVSGDGVDQDDLIAAAGAAGFDTPAERRSDRVELRGVRLPWVKFPRHPEL